MSKEKNIIETFNLTKSYHLKKRKTSILALDDVNIKIKEGEKFGLLGPNGAGKTTMVSILTTLMQPTRGYVIIDGFNILNDPIAVRNKIVLMLGNEMIYYRITGYDNLKFFCKIYQIPNYKEKIYNIAKEFNIEKWLNEYVERYSMGMKVKLSLCRTLLLDPKIYFLDEPTFGLDVKTVNFIVNKLKKLNKTIFLTSHNMNVVEKLCDRIAFINNGKIQAIGDKDYLKTIMKQKIELIIEILENKKELISKLEEVSFITNVNEHKNGILVELDERNNYSKLLSILQNYKILSIKESELSIEDLFMKII
ncbi:MAG: ABC transporter ATP-binding protein [Candidatus Lokiarchaeota archaeon]|nr:ABC transporter ATP-binding protein [Candidatus Lokiarchaeota archaeon]